MKNLSDYEYDYIERFSIITESGISEELAHAEAIYQVRADMVTDGMGFGDANIKVMGIKQRINK